MPITLPELSTSAPPLFPGLIAAEVWIRFSTTRFGSSIFRLSALTTPVVTVLPSPNGLPIAIASWPTWRLRLSPSRAAGSDSLLSTLITARSASGSRPINRPLRTFPPVSVTLMVVAPWTTWLFVRM